MRGFSFFRFVIVAIFVVLASGCSRCSRELPAVQSPAQPAGASTDESASEDERLRRLEDADAKMMEDEDNITYEEDEKIDRFDRSVPIDHPGAAKESEDRD